MKLYLRHIVAVFLAFAFSLAVAAPPASKPDLRLWRLDCGSLWTLNLDELSDTRAYVGQSKKFVGSCYLIRHGEAYLLWDTGMPAALIGHPDVNPVMTVTLRATIVDQLARIGIRPEQV